MTAPSTTPRSTVLVVEDDVDVARLLVRYLSTDYDVRCANDGVAGLREISASPPDLIVCDVMMPGIDGYAMVREMRAQGGRLPPVIFLTARGRTQDVMEGIQAGARHYLTKPVNLAELSSKIASALRGGSKRA